MSYLLLPGLRRADRAAAIFPLQSLAAPTYRLAPRMPTPRQVLDPLSRNELLALVDAHRLFIGDRRVKAHEGEPE